MIRSVQAFLDRAERALAAVANGCVYASAAGIFLIAVLLCASSIKRYLFHAPISVTEELGGLMFMATTFLALAGGFAKGRHVRLELLWRYIPAPLVPFSEFLMLISVNVALGVLVIETWGATVMSYDLQGKSVMTEILLWPWRLIMPACLGLFMAIATVRCLKLVFSGFKPSAVTPSPVGGGEAVITFKD